MEIPVIPGRIEMEQFIPVEIFRKERNTFRAITFFPFLLKRLKFFVQFVWLTSARLPLEAEGEKWRYFPRRAMVFRKWYNSNQCLFLKTFSSTVPIVRNFCRSFLTNGKRSGSMTLGNYSHWSILCCSHSSGLVYCCRLMKISNKFHLGAQTIIIFWWLYFWKRWPILAIYSMSILVIHSNRR